MTCGDAGGRGPWWWMIGVFYVLIFDLGAAPVSAVSPVLAVLDQPTPRGKVLRGQLDGLLTGLGQVSDPRDRRGRRYALPLVLALALLATCCGARTFTEVAEVAEDLDADLRDAVGVVRTTPSAATFCRILEAVDPDQLDAALCAWATPTPTPEAVAFDGKTMRGARTTDAAGRIDRVQVVAAYDHTGTVLGQVQVDGGDENAAVRDLIARLGGTVLTGAVVTVDAKHSGASLAAVTRAAGAHWLVPVKGNQPTMHNRLGDLPWPLVRQGDLRRQAARGRAETRTLKVLALAKTDDYGIGARQAIRVQRWTRRAGRSHRETVYYLTSLPPAAADPAALADHIRGHWSIENGLHHVRDLAFDEDRHTARTGHSPANLACLRNTAITLHRRAGARQIRPALRATNRRPQRLTDLLPA